jgi:outer membrane protein assembly factor BamB
LAFPVPPDPPYQALPEPRVDVRLVVVALVLVAALVIAAVVSRRGPPELEPRWRLQAGSAVVGAPQVEGVDLFAATRAGSVVAVDAETGEAQWRFETGERVMAEAVVEGGLVYVSTEVPGSSDGHVFALDARTGGEQWRFATDVEKVGPLALADGAVLLNGGDVIALDAVTGEIRWRQAVTGTGIVAAGAGVVVASTPVGLVALDPASGGLRWVVPTPAPPQGSPSVAGEVVITDDGAGTLVGLDPADGAEQWRAPAARLLQTPVAAGNLVVVATAEGVLALDARSGDQRWRHDGDGDVLRVATDGSAVAAVGGDRLALLDGATGDVVGEHRLNLEVPVQPAVAGDRVYVAAGEVVEALDWAPS